MAVPEQTPIIEYTANGTTTDFVLGFECEVKDYLIVTVDGFVPPVGSWSLIGGSVVFLIAPMAGTVIHIKRKTDLKRTTDYQAYDNSFRPAPVNKDFDTIWHVLQELNLSNSLTDEKLQELIDQIVDGNINGLPAEIIARIAGDQENLNLINAESLRAFSAEQALSVEIQNTEDSLTASIAAETARATSAENSLQTQVDSLGGGASFGYTSYALMVADAANIPAHSVVRVGGDPDPSKDGDYIYNGSTFSKSPYDPLTQAKNYSDLKAVLDGTQNLFQFLSNNGSTLLLMTKKKKLHIAGINGALQDVVGGILNKTNRFISDSVKNSLLSVKDDTNNTRFLVSAKNNIFCNDIVTKKTSLSKVDERLSSTEKTVKAQSLKYLDHVLTVSKNEQAMLTETTIFLEDSVENRLQLFSPVVVRIAKNKYLIFCESRAGGDFGDISVVYKTVTVNSDYSLSISNYSILANNENVNGVGFDCYNTCVIKTISGRIIVYYTKRFKSHETFTSLDFCCKTSDDDGATWSAERVLNNQFPDYETRRFVLAGPGKAIQLRHGKYKDRIVVPCYGALDGSYPVSSAGQLQSFLLLSDDNGQTYKIGAKSKVHTSNECAVAETTAGDIIFMTRNATAYKSIEISIDGGQTTGDVSFLKDPVMAVCQSGFAQSENTYDLQIPKLLMTSPADTLRRDLTLYMSYDNGQTFERKKQLMSGSASYSDVDVIDDTHIFVVYSFNNRRVSGIVVNLKTVYGA
ncbi:exo-alpha-sialidase [Acinetobacter haemolyticus]|uniref:exo-alpha-sialidase n=1 Tax=Acinetobacter haemolyticus TaxID=29430 RepID=A0A4P7B397_ACIHA|nr:sialidase family protein [Acinetobacter haemolyticus]QBQ15614.1 exo-alpha-sialidase [Acinetobacter haemolyticus]